MLSRKVFFWLTRKRLFTLLNARPYRHRPHDVIEVSTRKLVERHYERVWFSPMNSGCTKPWPHTRDETTFRRIREYPYASSRRRKARGERVVELAVDYSVPDIAEFVARAMRMRGHQVLEILHDRGEGELS